MDKARLEDALANITYFARNNLLGLMHYAVEDAVGLGATSKDLERAMMVEDYEIKGIKVKMQRNNEGSMQIVKEVFNL